MKNTWKKLLAMTLAVSMLTGMLGVGTLAAGEETGGEETRITYCGKEEHTHNEGCYEGEGWDTVEDPSSYVLDEDTGLYYINRTCGEEKHTHSEKCYELNGDAMIGNTVYETLQAAINAAKSGDTIKLTRDFTATGSEKPAIGTWLYKINAANLSKLTIDLNGHIVDCNNLYGWLKVDSRMGLDLTVRDGTIQNAAGCNQGSAIWAWKSLTLDEVTITGCTSSVYGGAVYVGSADETTNLTVTNCKFEGNEGWSGGGIYVGMAEKVNISDTTFINNTATGEYGFGGAFYVDHGPSTVTLTSCVFEENTAPYGGAISSYDNCKLVITACEFAENTAAAFGGAIYASGNYEAGNLGEFAITGTSFTGNTAQYGGAIYGAYLNTSKLENVTATSNTSDNWGGGFFLDHAPAMITGSTITKNTAVNGGGGGLYCSQSATTISNSTITENTAVNGGGIINRYDKLTLADGAKVHNNVAGSLGDDIYSSDAGYHESYPASLVLVVPEATALKSTGKTITGWYIDGQKGENDVTARWSVEDFYEEFNGEDSVVALKAAYGRSYTVTYTDGVEDVEVFADQMTSVEPGAPTPAFVGTPVREGYTFTGWSPVVAETVTGDVTYTAQWRANGGGGGGGTTTTYYTLTINYVDEDGNVVAEQHRERLESGSTYNVSSPAVEGYTASRAVVSGRLTGNITVDVVYTADAPVVTPDPTETSEPTPSETSDPTSSESPVIEELDENETPLAELPTETEQPAAEPPEEEFEDLEDEDVPMAQAPETGDDLGTWLMMSAGALFGLAWLGKKKEEA